MPTYHRYHVVYTDDGEEVVQKWATMRKAREAKAFLVSCARSDGKIRNIKLVTFGERS